MLKQCIADAKAVKAVALENAKIALAEAFTPRLQSMLSQKIREEAEVPKVAEDYEEEVVDPSQVPAEETPVAEEPVSDVAPAGEEEQMPTVTAPVVVQPPVDGSSVEEPASQEPVEEVPAQNPQDSELEEILKELETEAANLEEIDVTSVNEEENVSEVNPLDEENVDEEINLDELLAEISESVKDEEKDEKKEEEEDEDKKMDEVINEEATDPTPSKVDPTYDTLKIGKKNTDSQPVHKHITATKSAGAVSKKDKLSNTGKEEATVKHTDSEVKASSKSLPMTEEAKQISELKRQLNEYREGVIVLRNRLNEVNLLNAKLLFTNKLFKSHPLSNDQKVKVIESFDRTKDIREVKLVYSTLIESFKVQSNKSDVIRKASITEGIASKPVASTAPSVEKTKVILTEANEFANRLQKLAGIHK